MQTEPVATQNKWNGSHYRSNLCFTFMQPLSFLSLNNQGHKNCIGVLVVNQNLQKKDCNQYAWQRLIWCPGSERTSAKLIPIISQGESVHFSRMDGPTPASNRARCKALVMDATGRLSPLKQRCYVVSHHPYQYRMQDSSLPIISKNAHI